MLMDAVPKGMLYPCDNIPEGLKQLVGYCDQTYVT